MKETLLQNKKFQFIARLIPAVSFALFIFYQLVVLIYVRQFRPSRVIGMAAYLVLTLAAVFLMIDNIGIRIARLILFVAGMLFMISYRMMNAPYYFSSFTFADMTTVLNCFVFIVTQLGSILLLVGYLIHRAKIKQATKNKIVFPMMYVVIGLFALCLIMESILLIVYHVNIDIRVRYTLLSRLLFFLGYAGTAFCILLPAPERSKEPEKGEFYYIDEEEKDQDLVM